MAASDPLKTYKAKRDFERTSEPAAGGTPDRAAPSFVIQKHWASHLHYDFRLELDGTMKSWAVPKGPSLDPRDKRMAVHVEDHPISYNSFEGQIPAGQYGAGKVIIWDRGTWLPLSDPQQGYRHGNLKFELHGHKLRGRWVLVRMKAGKFGNAKQEPWLLIKEKDEYVRPASEYSIVDDMPDSVTALPDRTDHNDSDHAAPAKATKAPRKKDTASTSKSARTGPPQGAVKTAMPATLSPQLATLVDAPPADDDNAWQYEIKFDGYRILARVDDGDIRLLTRNGHDWSAKLPTLLASLKKMALPSGWYDGEIVVADERGTPDFQALQNAFDTRRTSDIIYYLFDLPYCSGHDLRQVPLQERRTILQTILNRCPSENVRFSDAFAASARELLASACHIGLEGVIGKRKDSCYSGKRSRDWIKLKCGRRQEFIIGGYTDPQGARSGLGSLLLGLHDENGKLKYAGNVGTGFSERTLAELKKKLGAMHADSSPFADKTGIERKAHWVKPTLLAEISFSDWTDGGRIRHGVFHGLRTDKRPQAITREPAMPSVKASKPGATADATSSGRLPADLRVSHPDRIIDGASGTTKMALIRYYALVAPLMMPHLKDRPVSLVRAPDGIDGQLFFQKHMESSLDGVRLLDPALDPDHASLIEIAQPRGLLSAAQMNVIEFHTWNGSKSAIDKPDRMTFDLDPGEGVSWEIVRESTLLMRDFLHQLGLASFAKTSGGKGMHVVVPLKRLYDWDTIKDFSHAIVEHMAQTLPMRFVAKSWPKNRVGKIFIDYLRNGFGATTVCAWSARSRPGMGVSVPLTWDEVGKLRSSAEWTVSNIHQRLDQGNKPWADYERSKQSPSAAMKLLGFVPPAKRK